MNQCIRIGTSGWSYRHWQGPFYPLELPARRWLEHYAAEFETVELNATFYRSPLPATFTNWRARTPDGFIWSVKASRYITHLLRLKEAEASLDKFYRQATLLAEKLGPVLFQLPPSLKFDPVIAAEFFKLLPAGVRHTVEARNESWFCENAQALFRERGVAWCVSDTAGRYPCHEAVTAGFAYLRLHGPTRLYASNYAESDLQAWAEKIRSWQVDTFVYFDNDFEAYAIANARRLKAILAGA